MISYNRSPYWYLTWVKTVAFTGFFDMPARTLLGLHTPYMLGRHLERPNIVSLLATCKHYA